MTTRYNQILTPPTRCLVGLLMLTGAFAAARAEGPLQPAALDYIGARTLAARDPNLTGKGVLIAAVCRSMTYIDDKAQNDYRFNMNHNSLYRSDVAFADGTDGRFGISSHATAIAGILVGRDPAPQSDLMGSFEYRGLCPEASIDVYEFWRFATMHLFDAQPFEADILTLSLGEKYEDWWTRAVENLAVEKNLILIASIGNGRDSYDLLYPGAGSNCIGVGVINAAVDADGNAILDDFSVPNKKNSSTGPTSDRRCKPDIVAPGTALVPVYNEDAAYVIRENWSSLAAPMVSGTTALLLQTVYADETLGKAFDRPEKNNVIKAILLNSAAKLPYWHKGEITPDDDELTPLDFTQGAGALDAAAAMNQLTAGRQDPGLVRPIGWDNHILKTDVAAGDYTLQNVEPNQMITATLCWNYHYQNRFPFDHDLTKDANLRLELWGIDPADGLTETLIAVSDSVNDNLEHIYTPSDERFSTYHLRVSFSDTAAPPTADHRYAIAWSVGADTAAGNPWWHDLNGDNIINGIDHLAYLIIDEQISNRLDEVFAEQALNLSPDRLTLLQTHWPTWKHYLSDWQSENLQTAAR